MTSRKDTILKAAKRTAKQAHAAASKRGSKSRSRVGWIRTGIAPFAGSPSHWIANLRYVVTRVARKCLNAVRNQGRDSAS